MVGEGGSRAKKADTVERMSDRQIRSHIVRLTAGVIDEKGDPKSQAKVQLHAPVLQMYAAELSGRFAKRTTIAALCVAVLSLVVSIVALCVSYQSAAANVPM